MPPNVPVNSAVTSMRGPSADGGNTLCPVVLPVKLPTFSPSMATLPVVLDPSTVAPGRTLVPHRHLTSDPRSPCHRMEQVERYIPWCDRGHVLARTFTNPTSSRKLSSTDCGRRQPGSRSTPAFPPRRPVSSCALPDGWSTYRSSVRHSRS